jgi:hypothetical protein
VNPIAGAQSLLIGTTGYGDSVIWTGVTTSVQAPAFVASVRLRTTTASTSSIRWCGLLDYSGGGYVQTCTTVAGSAGDKGIVTVRLVLDPARVVSRARVGVFQEGSQALSGVMLDEAMAFFENGSATPTPTATATATATSTPAATPTFTPTARPTATPTVRPTARPTATATSTATPTATSTPTPTVPTTGNRVEDPGFESGVSNFLPNQDGTSAVVTTVTPIEGAQSLLVGLSGYGNSVIWNGYEPPASQSRRFSRYTVAARVVLRTASASSLRLCALVSYADGGFAMPCATVSGAAGDKGTMTVTTLLDTSRDVDLVRMGFFQEGSAPLVNVAVDAASAVLEP